MSVWKYFAIIFLRRKEPLDNIKRTAVQDYDNIWARPTEKRLKNIRNRLSKANPFKRRKRLFSLKFRRWVAYAFFGLSALFMFLYYTDPTIFFRTQIGIMMLVGQFLYSFSILYGQLMSSIPNEYVPFVDAYWNIGVSVLVLAILYYLYYVVRRQRVDFVFKVFQIVVLLVILAVLYVFQLNKDPTVFGKAFDRITNWQTDEGSQGLSEKIRSDFIGYSLEDRIKIQSGLKDYGYYSTIDGLFGNATFLAVKNYMVENDIDSYKRAILEDIKEAKSNKKPSTRMLLAVGNEKPRNSYVRVVNASPYSVNIVDADTIDVGNDRVRLDGISADERGKPTYNSCKREVSSIIRKSSEVICYMSGEMTYNREVGECFVVNNGVQEDLNRLIVESGCARDCRRYSGGYYKKFETKVSKQLDLPNYCR